MLAAGLCLPRLEDAQQLRLRLSRDDAGLVEADGGVLPDGLDDGVGAFLEAVAVAAGEPGGSVDGEVEELPLGEDLVGGQVHRPRRTAGVADAEGLEHRGGEMDEAAVLLHLFDQVDDERRLQPAEVLPQRLDVERERDLVRPVAHPRKRRADAAHLREDIFGIEPRGGHVEPDHRVSSWRDEVQRFAHPVAPPARQPARR